MTENKSLITMPEKMPTFKSKALNTATNEIYKVAENVYTTAFEGNKQICIILARIEKTKAYKEDNFKSLADYCGAIGFDKSKVHKMENAGRLYDSENETVKEFASSMGYGNLAILASAKEEDVVKAIEDGEISTDSTQNEISSWKSTYNAKTDKDKVLPKFEVHGYLGNGNQFHYDSIELENVAEIDGLVKVGAFDLVVDYDKDGAELTHKYTVYANVHTGELVRIMYNKVKKETKAPKATKGAKELSKEDLIALAEKYGMKVSF